MHVAVEAQCRSTGCRFNCQFHATAALPPVKNITSEAYYYAIFLDLQTLIILKNGVFWVVTP
jgi:hypothetical protein